MVATCPSMLGGKPVQNEIESRIKAAGVVLPIPAASVANYLPFTVSGSTVYISGQLPFEAGNLVATGLLGQEVDVEKGYSAARACGLNVLAQLKEACGGDLGRVRKCLKLGGFVASAADFTDHPKVINGASDLMVELLADAGRHARFAVGVACLPLNAAVEVDATFEIEV